MSRVFHHGFFYMLGIKMKRGFTIIEFMVVVLVILIVSAFFVSKWILVKEPVREEKIHRESRSIKELPEEKKLSKYEKEILRAKKAACRENVARINTMVNLWYLEHDNEWPRVDLSDIKSDPKYFPDGIPTCPLDGTKYYLHPELHTVSGHNHVEIE